VAAPSEQRAALFPDLEARAAENGCDLRLGYGAFHMHYRLGGRLVAVGVVDVLPLCLSSVYLLYDPELPRLELGKLTALYEIAWVRAAQRAAPRLRFWYAGFYVHGCKKMRYKREFEPSELVCPVTRRWTPITPAVLARLDADKAPLIATADEATGAAAGAAAGGAGSESGPDAAARAAAAAQAQLQRAQAAGSVSRVAFFLSGGKWGDRVVTTRELVASELKTVVSKALLELVERTGTAFASRAVVKVE
jgi:hypothetical protein